MRRTEEGGMVVCHPRACLEIPATAPEFLAWLEFFETFKDRADG